MLHTVASHQPTDPPQPTWLRWAFVGIAALLTLVLAAATTSSFLGARKLAEAVVSGQASMLMHAAHRDLDLGPPPPTAAQLLQVIDDHAELGLRYMALVVGDDHVIVDAGTRAPQLQGLRISPDGAVIRRGGMARVTTPGGPEGKGLPRGPEGKAPGFRPPPWRPREGKALLGPPGPEGPLGPRPQILLEFEPTMAIEVEEKARRDLAIGLAAIAVLWGAAALFWRLATRAAAAESKLAGQRHLASLGEMSAVVAHELRNPLASLKGHAQLLQEQATEPRLAKKAQRIVDEAVRLQELSSGLLEFVRSGKVEREEVAVAQVLRDAVAGSIAEVDIDDGDAPQTWSLDATRIRQVIVNLLDNAHQAAPENRVQLRARRDGGALRISVRDRGPGVPADMREKIFAPFFTGRTHGTGLGLAVARRIVELHGGTIDCGEAEGGGALFTLRIPATTPTTQTETRVS